MQPDTQEPLPFIRQHYPDGHHFQQDNDLKHTSRWAQAYFEQEGINWWHMPASSPDLNKFYILISHVAQFEVNT